MQKRWAAWALAGTLFVAAGCTMAPVSPSVVPTLSSSPTDIPSPAPTISSSPAPVITESPEPTHVPTITSVETAVDQRIAAGDPFQYTPEDPDMPIEEVAVHLAEMVLDAMKEPDEDRIFQITDYRNLSVSKITWVDEETAKEIDGPYTRGPGWAVAFYVEACGTGWLGPVCRVDDLGYVASDTDYFNFAYFKIVKEENTYKLGIIPSP